MRRKIQNDIREDVEPKYQHHPYGKEEAPNDISLTPKMGRPTKKGRAFWGGYIWAGLHTFAAAYKPSAAVPFKNYIDALPYLLPCPSCGDHFKELITRYPPDKYMRNNHELFFWTYFAHDYVNQKCNSRAGPGDKKKISPSFDDVKRYYFSGLGEECKVCQL